MNITYSDDKKTLYYCKLDNKYVIDVFYDVIYILPKDICSIISEYYNCIKVDLQLLISCAQLVYPENLILGMEINDEYIDFKKVIHKGYLKNYSNNDWHSYNDWHFSGHDQNSIIYMCDGNDDYRSICILNAYVKQIYKINDYLKNKYYYKFGSDNLEITNSIISMVGILHKRQYKILDVTLFRYLIEIFKSIIDTYSS